MRTRARTRLRPIRRSLGLLLVAALLALVPQLALPRVAEACSCVGPQPLARYAQDGSVIIAGRVDRRAMRGVRVAVSHWFAGSGAEPVVWISGDFGNGASCGVGSEPAVGSEWIWVAWRSEARQDLSISICAPTAPLSDAAGQALLAEAILTFGSGTGEPVGSPGDQVDGSDAGTSFHPALLLATAAVIGAGLVVLGGVVVVGRRRHTA